jgi:hypothetical protein
MKVHIARNRTTIYSARISMNEVKNIVKDRLLDEIGKEGAVGRFCMEPHPGDPNLFEVQFTSIEEDMETGEDYDGLPR